MLRLKFSRDPAWHELAPGVRVLVRPITSGIIGAARADAHARSEGADVGAFAIILSAAVARIAIIGWEGVGDADGNLLTDPTPETIDVLMEHPLLADAFWDRCVVPAFRLDDEKKGSAPLPDTGSDGAPIIAETATASAPTARAN